MHVLYNVIELYVTLFFAKFKEIDVSDNLSLAFDHTMTDKPPAISYPPTQS
jgi:hypothetical protein